MSYMEVQLQANERLARVKEKQSTIKHAVIT